MLSNKKTTITLVFAILVLAGLLLLTWFLYQKILESSSVIALAEARVMLLEKKEREFSLAEAGVRNSEKEIEFLDSFFLDEGKFVDLLDLLANLSRKARVGFSAQSIRVPTENTASKDALLSFEITGSFGAILNFFSLLDNIPYAGLIENVNIQKIGPETSETLLASISYKVFNFGL